MKKTIAIVAAVVLLPVLALATATHVQTYPDSWQGLSETIDEMIGSTRGSILYRGAAGWVILAPGTSTHVLTSNGAGADPSYQAAAGGGAPTGAEYLVSSADGTLSAERVATDTTSIDVDAVTAAQIKWHLADRDYGAITVSGTGATMAIDAAAVSDTMLASNYSGVGACGANTWASTLNDNAAPTCTQPGFSSLSAGTAADGQIDGSLEADEVNPTLGSQTQGNYVASATANQGLLLTGTEGGSLGLQDCAANEVLLRNAGDTAWECGTPPGGSGISYAQMVANNLAGF